jgi:cytochrome b561
MKNLEIFDPVFSKKFARFLHWSIALLIISSYAIGLVMNHITGHKAFYLYDLHLQTGMLLIILVIFRISWRYSTSYKKISKNLKSIKSLTTEYLYVLLYILMLAITLSGIIFVQAKGRPLVFFEIFDLPQLIAAKPKIFTRFIFQWHKWLAHTLLIFAGFHMVKMLIYKLTGKKFAKNIGSGCIKSEQF